MKLPKSILLAVALSGIALADLGVSPVMSFSECMTGPDWVRPACMCPLSDNLPMSFELEPCSVYDTDGDGDIDLRDYAVLVNEYGQAWCEQ